MSVEAATGIWLAIGAYLGAGAIFAVPFLLWAAPALDCAARGAGLLFRLTIAPGVVALWPALLIRLLTFRVINRPAQERSS
jgi:hypothetical protein